MLDIVTHPLPERLLAADADAVEVAYATRNAKPRTGGNHPRPLNATFLDRIPETHVAVSRGAEILHCRESCIQRRARIRRGISSQREVNVSVDQSRQQDHGRQIHDRSVCGYLHIGSPSSGDDPVALDDDRGVFDKPPGIDVDHASRLQDDRLLLR